MKVLVFFTLYMAITLLIFDFDYTLWNWDEHKFYPDVPVILETLKSRGYTLSMASYNRKCEYILKEYNLRHFFESVICDADFIERGDNKLSFLQRALAEANATPQQAMFFDDFPVFIKTAKSMNIKTVLVRRGLQWADIASLEGNKVPRSPLMLDRRVMSCPRFL